MAIECIELDKGRIDSIGPLWDKLREHQRARSPHFAAHYERRKWPVRRAELLARAGEGGLHIDVARDSGTGRFVGYCVSTVSATREGRLESIYLEPDCRKLGLGDILMKRALDWMAKEHTVTRTLIVGAGNEEVLGFYARYGFYPKHITVEQVSAADGP